MPTVPFMCVLEHNNVLGGAHCIAVVVDHIGGEVDNVERIDPAVTQLEIIHDRLGGDVGVYGIGVS